jgi:Spy/CpxP family protein refolding chaperone
MRNQKAIGLTDEQKTTIRGELLQAQTRFTELQWELQDQVESLVSLLKQEKVDEQQALAQLDKVLDVEREIKRAQIGLMVRIKNKLTPEQQAQLREIRGRGFPGRRLPPGPRPQ